MDGKIYAAISAVMRDIGAVGKNDINNFDKYKFRGIDSIMNALSPAMVKNKVFAIPELLESTREERTSKQGGVMIYSTVKIKYTFYTEDGSSVSAVVLGEAMDRSDKSTNKAMSAAFKYACFQTFCIPTEELKDADKESPQVEPREDPKTEPMAEPEGKPDHDLTPHGEGMTEARVNRLRGELKRTGRTEDGMLKFCKVTNIMELTEAQYIALMNKLMKTKSK